MTESLSLVENRSEGSLTLRLPHHDNYSVTLNRSATLIYFGDTVLGATVQIATEGSTDTIDLTQPECTPGALNELKLITEGRPPSEFKELPSLWKYLGGKLIPVLV